MARKTGKAKKWAVSAALVGGVAAGVVTAAGASTTSRPTTDPIEAEASQLHQQVLSLSNQEQHLKSELRSRSAQTPPTTTLPPASSGDSVKPSQAPAEVTSTAAATSSTAAAVTDTDRGSSPPPTTGSQFG